MAGYGGNQKNDVWSSPDGITWTEVTSSAAWSGRNVASSAFYDEKMWFMAGSPSGGSEVWSSTDGSAWSLTTSDTGWGNRTQADAVVLNGRIWLIAGYADGYKNDVWHTSD
jgi:leucine-zipper-like transcriptional regulator 1